MTLPEFNKPDIAEDYSPDEERLCRILSKIRDCGEVSAMITYSEPEKYSEKRGKPVGAVVVYEGLDTPEMLIRISEAVQAVLDLPAHKVKVYNSE